MKQIWQTILVGGAFALALSACSSTGGKADKMSGSSSAGATSSGTVQGESRTGVNSGLTPPPTVSNSTSTGGVIDDRVNQHTDVPGTNR